MWSRLMRFFVSQSPGGADLAVIVTVEADDVAVIVDEGVCRMGNDKHLATQAVDVEKSFQELYKLGVFVV